MRISGLAIAAVGASAALIWFSVALYASVSTTEHSLPSKWEVSTRSRGSLQVSQLIQSPGDLRPFFYTFTRDFESPDWQVASETNVGSIRKPLSSDDPRLRISSVAQLTGSVQVRVKWIGGGLAPEEVVLEVSRALWSKAFVGPNWRRQKEAQYQEDFRSSYSTSTGQVDVMRVPVGNEDALIELHLDTTFPVDNIPDFMNPYLVRVSPRVASFSLPEARNFRAETIENDVVRVENENPDPRDQELDFSAVASGNTGPGAAIMEYESPTFYPKLYGVWNMGRTFKLSDPAINNFQFDDSRVSRSYTETDLESMIAGKPDLRVLTLEVSDGELRADQTAQLAIRVHAPYEIIATTPYKKVYGPWTRSTGGFVFSPGEIVGAGLKYGMEPNETRPRYLTGIRVPVQSIDDGKSSKVLTDLGLELVPSKTFPAGFIRAFLAAAGSPSKSAYPPKPIEPLGLYGPFDVGPNPFLFDVVCEIELRTVAFERNIMVREFGRTGFIGTRTLKERRALSEFVPGNRKENFEARMKVAVHLLHSGPIGKTLFYVYEDGNFELAPEDQETGMQRVYGE